MGASQSLDAFFGSPNIPSNSEQADVYQYLRRVERTLWITSPFWDEGDVEAAETRIPNPTKLEATPRDPFKKMVESVAKIFVAVRGMDKAMALLDSQDQQATHLALEVIFALCAGSSGVIRPFCEAGLIGRLTELIKGDNLELVLASLKVLRLTLRQTENLAELLRLGCIDTFLRLMTPTNSNADAVIFALSLIADETDSIFPREQTTATLGRMLETLRGAAKRSPAASATSFLFASLAKSSIFHSAICSEANLGILAKLLVGGSPESLMRLVALSLSSSGPARDEKVARLAIFALATVTNEALVSPSGTLVRPELLLQSSGALEPLCISTIASCEGMQGSDFLPHVYVRAIKRPGPGSTYALKLLAALSTARHVKEHMCEAESVARMLQYLRGANCILAFCKLMETTPDALQILALHEQVLGFLDGLTSKKNTRALEQIFASDPDRIANLLQASLNTRVQLLGATLLRRLFKRLNSIDIPSTAAQRHLAKLLSASSVDQMVAVAACRVWGNLFQYEDKRLAFAQIRIHHDSSLNDLEAEEKKVTKQSLIVAPHFLCIMELFPHFCDPIARLAIDTVSELARSKTPGLRRTLAVPVVLNAIQQLLRDRERASTGLGVLPQRHVLRFLGLLARRDAAIQHLVVESRLLEALLLLLHSPSTALTSELLGESLDALAWVCSAARSPTDVAAQAEIDDEAEIKTLGGEAPARRVVATSKMVDFSLRHADTALAPVARASLHLLQRLACEQPGVPRFVYDANGVSVVMRALQQRPEYAVRRRACGLLPSRTRNEGSNAPEEQDLSRKLQIKGLQALAALCEGSSPAARASKKELLECEQSSELVRLVSADDDERLCAAWTRALAMGAFASSNNQRRLLLAYLAAAPENRGIVVNEGGDALLSAIITGLQSELPGLQRYAALLVANLATRHEGNKVRLGAAGAASPLVDRLSSQRRNVLENVLLAVVKLGSHAGNKVKLGGKVCFEKLLALVHHETLQVAKGAARALAVLVVGNDANKKFLLQCEAPLAPMPAQALELSRCVDVLSVVKLLTHINPCIARAALLVVRHLTRDPSIRLALGFVMTVTCLANLSFASSNASLIAERDDSLLLLLQLTTSALPTAVEGYLSEKDKAHQRVDTDNNDQAEHDEEMYESMARNSPKKGGNSREKSDARRQGESADSCAEQTLLVLSNCADHYRTLKVVDILAVAVLCQALLHSSELVARCGCYTLACWLKQNTSLQDAATKRGALQTLSKLLTSSSLVVVEAAAYVLSKLAARGDNPMKLLALDVPATLVHGILRKPANVPHDRVLDRAVRLLGTLVHFSRVRQGLKGEEIIADTLGKNLSRLVLALLADDSLKFFLPKKTRETIRNVLRIFVLLVTVEEHKTTITLEDSGEALGRMVQELRTNEGVLGVNDETVLGLLACIAGTRKIAAILHENDVYSAKTLEVRRLQTVQIAARLCKALSDQAVRRLSELEFTSLLLELLRVGLPSPQLPEAEGEEVVRYTTASPATLSQLVWECLDVLRLLCSSPYDEQVIVEEGGVVVLVAYFELWLSVTSGVAPELFPSGGEALVLAFAVSLSSIIRTLSAQTPNRELLVHAGGFPLVLKALGLGTTELPNPQRELLAEALAGLTALPIMVPYLEASPDPVAPMFRFMVAPQTQQLTHLLLLALRSFADVMEASPASRSYVVEITGGSIQPLPFLLSCLECSSISASDDSILTLLHAMRSIQRLVTDEATARVLSSLDDLPAIGRLLSLVLHLPSYDDRLEIVQLMATETLGYLAFFDYTRDKRVKPEHIATSIWTLTLLATPQVSSSGEEEEVKTTANSVRSWIWGEPRGLDVLISCGLGAPEYLNLPTSVVSDVLAVLTTATEKAPEAETVLAHLVQKRVCTHVAALLEAVEPAVRRPALQLLARILNKQVWASNEPLVGPTRAEKEPSDERWSAVLLHLAEWLQVYARDPQSTPLSELRDAYSCLSVLTAHNEVAVQFQKGEAPRGLINIVATSLHHFGGKRLPSRPESLVLIRRESAVSEDPSPEATDTAERARMDWTLQFTTVLHVLRLHVPRALDSLVLLHDRQILDEALRCMLHLATLHGEETELLFSSDRTVARLKGLLQSESRPLQARITPILSLMAANMPTLPGLCSMDGILSLSDLAVSSSVGDILAKTGDDAARSLDRRVFEDSCTMLHVIFSQEEGIILAFDVAQVVPKLFGIVEKMTATCMAWENEVAEAPELLHLPLSVLVKVSAVPAVHVRYLELLPRICRLLDGENGPAKLTGRWCEMLLLILFNVFRCPFGSNTASVKTLSQGKNALLPQLLPLDRWLSVVDSFPALGRFVIELIRAFVGDGELSSPYATLLNSGEDIPALLTLVGSLSDEVAIPSAQLLLAVLKQRDVRVAVIVADGVPALVVALCQAKNITVQNLLLALILVLSRGDTEVQALLLIAPGCVARLVEFVQESVDIHAVNDKKEIKSSVDERLKVTCTLLTELSRALHGPERIVEVKGHLPLLALSIQQQEGDIQGAQTTVQILTNLAFAGMTVAPGLATSKLPAHFLSCVLSDEKEAAKMNKKRALPLKRRLALTGLVALAKANRELRATLAQNGPLVVFLESLLEEQDRAKVETSSTLSCDALLLLYLMSSAGCVDLVSRSSREILSRICSIINQNVALHKIDDGLQDEEFTPVEVTRGLKLLANLLDVAHEQKTKLTWYPEILLDLVALLEARVAAHQSPKRQLPALRVLRGSFALAIADTTKNFYYPLTPKLLAELLTVLLVSASRQHREMAERIVVSAFQNDPERARESVGDNQILEQLLIVFTQPGTDASQLAVVLTQVLYVSVARGFVVSQRFLAKLPALLASYHEALESDDTNQPLKRALSIYLSFVHSSCPPTSAISTGHFIEEMKAAGARSAVENNPLISPDDKALPVALLGMLGYSADLNEEFARALEQFDAARSEAKRRERVAYLLRFLERYALTHAPTKEQAIDSFMTYLVADAEKAQTAAMATEHEPEVTKDEQASASKLALMIAGDCLASLVKISGWSPPERSLSATLSGFGELYLSRWDLNALLAVAFARQRGDEDNEFQERPRLAIAQISQVLELAALVRAQLEENSRTGGSGVVVVGQIDARWLCNAFMLVTGIYSSDRSSLARNGELNPVEQVLALVHWLAVNSSTCFEDICRNAALLRAFFAPQSDGALLKSDGNDGEHSTPGAETTASIDELLVEVLKFLYAQVDNGLQHNTTDVLLVSPTNARCSKFCGTFKHHPPLNSKHDAAGSFWVRSRNWIQLSLRYSISMLSPFFFANVVVIPVSSLDRLQEVGDIRSVQWRSDKLKLLSVYHVQQTHDEVLLKIGEAPGIAAVLFGFLASSAVNSDTSRKSNTKGMLPVDSAGTQAHAAHLIARIAAQEDLRASLVSPENISLLIESLESVHLPVVLHALQALAHLCASSLCLDALVRNATVPVLAQILFSPLVETLRRREIEACVLALLGKMCDRSQIVSRRVVSSNLLPKLCEFLVVDKQLEYTQQEPQSDELGVHNNAVWIVYSLSKDVELVPKLVAHSILETLSDQLLEYDQNSTQRKALGAMSRLAGVAELDAMFLQSLISQLVESVRRNVPIPDAHHSVTNALAVFNAILKAGKNRPHQQRHRRPPNQQQRRAEDSEVNIRQILLKGEGLRIALDLLGVADARIKLEAFRVVSEFVEDHPDFNEVRELLLGSEEQGGSHALLSLVRALSDEARSSALPSTRSGKNDLLLVALTLLNMLLSDEILKMKLTPTTYDVVLQVVVAISATASNLRVLGESLKALTTMTRAGQVADLCPEAALVSSVEPLVKILQGLSEAEGGSSTTMRLNALFLLVNFASSDQCRLRMAHCGALQALLGIIQTPGGATPDDQLVQLALLGVALMTTGGVSDAAAVVELSRAVDTLVRLLSSKSPSIQANAVWVVSNISSEGILISTLLVLVYRTLNLVVIFGFVVSLKSAIVARGGPTALQAMLNDNMSSDIPAPSNGGATQPQRPASSTMRIREYAPKAIKALGFAPIMPQVHLNEPLDKHEC
ncbi:Armadillo-type fold [Phytophthora cactorum]|nr:Armadillo-type fold [Phytophthora cactorum]